MIIITNNNDKNNNEYKNDKILKLNLLNLFSDDGEEVEFLPNRFPSWMALEL